MAFSFELFKRAENFQINNEFWYSGLVIHRSLARFRILELASLFCRSSISVLVLYSSERSAPVPWRPHGRHGYWRFVAIRLLFSLFGFRKRARNTTFFWFRNEWHFCYSNRSWIPEKTQISISSTLFLFCCPKSNLGEKVELWLKFLPVFLSKFDS